MEEERTNHHMDHDETPPTFCGWKAGHDIGFQPMRDTITLTRKAYDAARELEFPQSPD
jgi:hypothetical protein